MTRGKWGRRLQIDTRIESRLHPGSKAPGRRQVSHARPGCIPRYDECPRHGTIPSSYVSNYVHGVFSTKVRARLIPADVESELWAYLAGIAENHGIQPVSIGGMADHIHALINLGPILNIAKAAQVLKANSSRWMKEHGSKGFEWQEGYFACSVSRSQVPVVARYGSKPERAPSKDRFG